MVVTLGGFIRSSPGLLTWVECGVSLWVPVVFHIFDFVLFWVGYLSSKFLIYLYSGVSMFSWSRSRDRWVFRLHRRMEVCWCNRGEVNKNWSDFTNFTVCVLSLRTIVTFNSSKFSLSFELGSLDSLGYSTIFSTFCFTGRILS